MHGLTPEFGGEPVGFFECDPEAVFTRVADDAGHFGNVQRGIAQQSFGFFQPALGQAGFEGNSAVFGKQCGKIGGVPRELGGTAPQGQRLRIILLDPIEQSLHELFGMTLPAGPAGERRGGGKMSFQCFVQTGLFLLQSDQRVAGAAQFGLAQLCKIKGLHVLHDESEQLARPMKLAGSHHFGLCRLGASAPEALAGRASQGLQVGDGHRDFADADGDPIVPYPKAAIELETWIGACGTQGSGELPWPAGAATSEQWRPLQATTNGTARRQGWSSPVVVGGWRPRHVEMQSSEFCEQFTEEPVEMFPRQRAILVLQQSSQSFRGSRQVAGREFSADLRWG